jgi:hypothetical protein
VPERAGVHALEVLDHFQHADLTVPLDEGLELACDLVELFGGHAAGQDDLDRLRIVVSAALMQAEADTGQADDNQTLRVISLLTK